MVDNRIFCVGRMQDAKVQLNKATCLYDYTTNAFKRKADTLCIRVNPPMI